MNRWVLLEHKILNSKIKELHYDFLVEDKFDCFTWKLHEIPSFKKASFKITKQPNHRLVWLSRAEYTLPNDRGLVKRIDNGTFSHLSNKEDSQDLKIVLDGNLLKGVLTIDGNLCQFTRNN